MQEKEQEQEQEDRQLDRSDYVEYVCDSCKPEDKEVCIDMESWILHEQVVLCNEEGKPSFQTEEVWLDIIHSENIGGDE